MSRQNLTQTRSIAIVVNEELMRNLLQTVEIGEDDRRYSEFIQCPSFASGSTTDGFNDKSGTPIDDLGAMLKYLKDRFAREIQRTNIVKVLAEKAGLGYVPERSNLIYKNNAEFKYNPGACMTGELLIGDGVTSNYINPDDEDFKSVIDARRCVHGSYLFVVDQAMVERLTKLVKDVEVKYAN